MSSDIGDRESGGPTSDFTLPNLLDVKIRRVPYRRPKPRNFASVLSEYTEAIEFTVRTDRPIPTRGLGPALYVGHRAVTESEESEPTVYRFLALDVESLRPGAPIRLGWTGQPIGRNRTAFRYEPP
jgi:hypothetical protein